MIRRIKNFFINGFRAVKMTNKQDVKNIYKGNVALVYVYWILPLLLILPLDIVLRMLDYYVGNESNPSTPYSLLIVGVILFVIYVFLNIFWSISAWRSANHYQGRKLWPRLTKFSIILGLSLYFISLLINFAQGVSEETQRQILAKQAAADWTATEAVNENPDLMLS